MSVIQLIVKVLLVCIFKILGKDFDLAVLLGLITLQIHLIAVSYMVIATIIILLLLLFIYAAKKETFEERVANGWSPTRRRTLSLLVDSETKQYIKELEESSDIYDQADIMHFLYKTKYV